MAELHNDVRVSSHRLDMRTGIGSGLAGALMLFLIALVATGQTWRAVAYALVILFGFLVLLAIYFWGAMVFGSVLDGLLHRQGEPVPWTINEAGPLVVPEHDLDPGLELAAAGMLVYRVGEVRPRVYFRKVPLANARAVRPFVVARTGSERPYHFSFTLTDESDAARFDREFDVPLADAPKIVMPPYRLLLSMPRRLVGQRWNLQVRSGVTVVTSFRFMFVEGRDQPPTTPGSRVSDEPGELMAGEQRDLLLRLLDEAIKHDAMSTTQEIVLEDA